jgi:hypothetical protein
LLLIGRYVNSAADNRYTLQSIGYNTANALALPASFNAADPNAHISFALSDLNIDTANISYPLHHPRSR